MAAWRLRGAFATNETYGPAGNERFRAALSLGDALPVLPQCRHPAELRRGVTVVELEVEPLPTEIV